jgi:hypothetical protein
MADAIPGQAFRPQLRPPYKQMGAPACPGLPRGLAFETWDPPSRVYGMNGNGSPPGGVLVEREIYLTPLSGSQTPCSLRT